MQYVEQDTNEVVEAYQVEEDTTVDLTVGEDIEVGAGTWIVTRAEDKVAVANNAFAEGYEAIS